VTPWHSHPVAIIDFETTGVDPDTCMPVQVGLARFEHGECIFKHSLLINPGVPIPAEASAIHGITDADVSNAPSPAAALAEIRSFTSGAFPCGYNGQGFDRVIWERFCDQLGEWIDPLVMVRHVDQYVRGKGRHKLDVTCKRWGVTLGQAHNALHDCVATGSLLFSDRMRALLGDMTHEELISRQEKRRAEQDTAFSAWLAKQPPREVTP